MRPSTSSLPMRFLYFLGLNIEMMNVDGLSHRYDRRI